MNILPGFGCPDKVRDVFSPRDRTGICEAGLGEVSTGQCPLSCCLACGIDIKDDVAASLPIPDTPDGFVRPPLGKAVLLKERAKRFQAGTVYTRQETTQAGAMGKLSAPKEGHERSIKRS